MDNEISTGKRNIKSPRILLHCDLDAFFASVEALHLNLDEKTPLIIGADPQFGKGRGIVSTCNYSARAFGIKSAMPISEAWRRCPGPPVGTAIYRRVRFSLYRRASRMVMHILKNNSDIFESAGIDEAYLDITSFCNGDWDQALSMARVLQKEILDRTSLSASFGIGSTRIIAKLASEVNKPHGIHRILPEDVYSYFTGLPVRDVPGIGPATATRLAEWGITTMDEAHTQGTLALSSMLGKRLGHWLVSVVEAETSDVVSPIRSRKSIGKEHTFAHDVSNVKFVENKLMELVKHVCRRLSELNICGRLLEVKLRYSGFKTLTHCKLIPVAMNVHDVFEEIAIRLLFDVFDQHRAVRLVGFRVGQLESLTSKQLTLRESIE